MTPCIRLRSGRGLSRAEKRCEWDGGRERKKDKQETGEMKRSVDEMKKEESRRRGN